MDQFIQQLVDQWAAGEAHTPLADIDIDQTAKNLGLSRHALFNEIADRIAIEFLANRLSFDNADRAANDLFAYSCHLYDPLEGFAFEVFQAFDAGESFHSPCEPGTDPVEKFTIPQLRAALESHGSHA